MCENSVGPPPVDSGARASDQGQTHAAARAARSEADVRAPRDKLAFLTAVGTGYSVMKFPVGGQRVSAKALHRTQRRTEKDGSAPLVSLTFLVMARRGLIRWRLPHACSAVVCQPRELFPSSNEEPSGSAPPLTSRDGSSCSGAKIGTRKHSRVKGKAEGPLPVRICRPSEPDQHGPLASSTSPFAAQLCSSAVLTLDPRDGRSHLHHCNQRVEG